MILAQRARAQLRIAAWAISIGIALFCGLVATSLLIARQTEQRDRDQFARLAPREHRLAIYDAFWNQVSAHYYDQRFTGFAWQALRRDWRPTAADAATDQDLYLNVLFQLVQQFPSSHFDIMPPPASTAPVAASESATTANPLLTFESDLGFEPVTVRRGAARQWLVGDVTKGSAADSAGIEPGWAILSGTLTYPGGGRARYAGEFIDPAAHKVSVSLEVTAPAPRPQHLIRVLPDGAVYIRFDSFLEPATIDKVLAAIDTADQHGLILDLRGNTGGLISQERRLMSRLLPARSVLGSARSSSGIESWRASIFSAHYQGPLIVLIGPRSASAAEVVAAAVQGNHRGLLIGRTTNGSVLLAQRFPLPDGGSVLVPASDFMTPDGRRIEGAGVLPDIEIMPTLKDIRAGHDLVLERAERELRAGACAGASRRCGD